MNEHILSIASLELEFYLIVYLCLLIAICKAFNKINTLLRSKAPITITLNCGTVIWFWLLKFSGRNFWKAGMEICSVLALYNGYFESSFLSARQRLCDVYFLSCCSGRCHRQSQGRSSHTYIWCRNPGMNWGSYKRAQIWSVSEILTQTVGHL